MQKLYKISIDIRNKNINVCYMKMNILIKLKLKGAEKFSPLPKIISMTKTSYMKTTLTELLMNCMFYGEK